VHSFTRAFSRVMDQSGGYGSGGCNACGRCRYGVARQGVARSRSGGMCDGPSTPAGASGSSGDRPACAVKPDEWGSSCLMRGPLLGDAGRPIPSGRANCRRLAYQAAHFAAQRRRTLCRRP
jgi:hypothetical protein